MGRQTSVRISWRQCDARSHQHQTGLAHITPLLCSLSITQNRTPCPGYKALHDPAPAVSTASSCTTLSLAHNIPASLASLLVLSSAKPLSARTALLTALARVAQSHPSHLSSNVTDAERPFLTVQSKVVPISTTSTKSCSNASPCFLARTFRNP